MSQPYPEKSYLPFIFYPTAMWENKKGDTFVEDHLDLQTPYENFVIYISIPFCRVRCSGCPYFVSLLTPSDTKQIEDAYVDALIKDIKKWGSYPRWKNGSLRSIYIGGGTGSILKVENLKRVLDALEQSFPMAADCEVTLEGNARDYDEEKLDFVSNSIINRISLGVQSFDKSILKIVGSPHAAESSEKVIRALQQRGMDNIQLDMMFNMPGHTMDVWKSDLAKLKELNIKHLTIYLYRIHAGTPQDRYIKEGKVPDIQDRESEMVKGMYKEALKAAEDLGFGMYMFDHFCQPGYSSQYNDWGFKEACDTLGIGAGAYSLIDNYRIGTSKDVDAYIQKVNEGHHMVTSVSEKMELSNHKERYVIFSLQYFGINFSNYKKKFNTDFMSDFGDVVHGLLKRGVIALNTEGFEMTPLGREWRLNVILEFINPIYWGNKKSKDELNWSMNVPMVDLLSEPRERWLGVS